VWAGFSCWLKPDKSQQSSMLLSRLGQWFEKKKLVILFNYTKATNIIKLNSLNMHNFSYSSLSSFRSLHQRSKPLPHAVMPSAPPDLLDSLYKLQMSCASSPPPSHRASHAARGAALPLPGSNHQPPHVVECIYIVHPSVYNLSYLTHISRALLRSS
jgi:hypothetical protein